MSPLHEAGLTGVFGGTFNPVHHGHLRAAEEVRELLDLASVVFVPSADPPLKGGGSERMAPAARRLEWVQLATEGNPRFSVDDLELAREGPSYTVDTLEIFAARLSPRRPVFVIGCDAFAELASWREPRRLLTLSHFAVITRPDAGADPGGALADWLPVPFHADFDLASDGQSGQHRQANTWVRRLGISALDISATDIRRRLRSGGSVRYLLPEGVRGAVASSGIYGQ